MFNIAIITLALATGGCPTCGDAPNLGYGEASNVGYIGHGGVGKYGQINPYTRVLANDSTPLATLHPCPWIVSIPRCTVGCVGQNCRSCGRPNLPGAPAFDYRREFNYPWSQAPCYLPPAHVSEFFTPGAPEGYPIPAMPEEIPAGQARRRVKPETARRIESPTAASGAPGSWRMR